MSPPAPAPSSPHCGQGADPANDPVGCRGAKLSGYAACLAHLSDTDRSNYLAGLTPGADIDHGGTTFTESLLISLLDALRDPTTRKVHVGSARFDGAQFSAVAPFAAVRFSGDASFDEAQFSGPAGFIDVRFSGDASFDEARFFGDASFDDVQFSSRTSFNGAQFSGEAEFGRARFSGDAHFVEARFGGRAGFIATQFSGFALFDEARFSDAAWFGGAEFLGAAMFGRTLFSGDAGFDGVRFCDNVIFGDAHFRAMSWFGPFVCGKTVDLSGAVFEAPVSLEIAAREVHCVRTRWQATATVRLRYTTVDLSHAVLSAPVAITAHPARFTISNTTMIEDLLTGVAGVRVASVQGVDATHLVLTDTDLTDCLFSGAFHLDQLRLEGRCIFATAPVGLHRRAIWPVRWTRRRVLAEEHHWRAQQAHQPVPVAGQTSSSLSRAWRTGPHHPDPDLTPDPEDVAAIYRQLRKAFEDGKNEPGAADFYYGEMEMRRHDRTGTPPGERGLLFGYWLLSGYGLRSSRALSWLLAAMSLTVLLLMGFGLPTHDPDPATTGILHGSEISLTTSTPDPALHEVWSQRMTWARAEKATRVAVNSVVFRSSGQNLTTAGTYVEMASRLLEPTLLALAALAVRGRIKR
ncbi:pentapeptide repeat-containing protein [Streptomyces sp. NPDC054783]